MCIINLDRKIRPNDLNSLENTGYKTDGVTLAYALNQKRRAGFFQYIALGIFFMLFTSIPFVLGNKANLLLGHNQINMQTQILLHAIFVFACICVAAKEINALYTKSDFVLQQKLNWIEHYDRLTGLYNRKELEKRLSSLADQNNSINCALIMLDIDNFRHVNNTMGHHIGDQLLVAIGKRLMENCTNNCTIYRGDGDEFIVLMEDLKGYIEAESLAGKLQEQLKSGFEIDGSAVFIASSGGIAFSHKSTSLDLVKKAEIALYKAKELGKNKMLLYCEQMHRVVEERAAIEKYLHTALERDEFELHYQPQLDMETKRITGFEALIRWRNPQLGFVSPMQFITIAEETNLIIPIGEWVLKSACLFIKRLERHSRREFNIAVNISVIQLLQENFVDMVMDALEFTQLAPEYLELEITETILMESCEVIDRKLRILREKGIRVALDDFGKGYSSLGYLKNLPITSLKIDKSFVDTISDCKNSHFLIDIIMEIGKNMSLSVIAEGVESQVQMDYLKQCDCSKMQGHFFSKALPEQEAIEKVLKQEQRMLEKIYGSCSVE